MGASKRRPFLGALAPVEEPSTASQTDACTAAIAVRRTGFEGSERRDRTDDFFDVEVQRGVHHLVRVVGAAVLGELGREAAPREYRGALFTCAGAGSLAGIEDPAC